MCPLITLHREHGLLFQLVDALDDFARRLDGNHFDLDEARAHAHLLRELVVRIHYEKEEQVLLPFLVRHGFDWSGDVLREVREKQQHVGWLVEAFGQLVESMSRRQRDGQRRLAATAATLASLQRSLSASQDVELFPDVMTRLDTGSLRHLHEQLVDFDDRSGAPVSELSSLLRQVVRSAPRAGSAGSVWRSAGARSPAGVRSSAPS